MLQLIKQIYHDYLESEHYLAVLLLGSALEEEQLTDVFLNGGRSGCRHVLTEALDP